MNIIHSNLNCKKNSNSITMTKLFNIIIGNDYNTLNKLLENNNNININCVNRQNQSLIYKAIEVRARECFDILINLDTLNIIYNKSSNINGLEKALDYCIISNNNSNNHYLNKLLDKNIPIDCNSILKSISNIDIFNKLFNKIEKTENNIYMILLKAITNAIAPGLGGAVGGSTTNIIRGDTLRAITLGR